jgi:type IV pilus assembly protein PilE
MNLQSRRLPVTAAGFTLIELLIAMLIVGVISAYAFSSYQKSILKSGRSEAKSALTQIAAQEEQYRFSNSKYSSSVSSMLPTSKYASSSQTNSQLYTLAITAATNTYTIVATPVSTGRQAKDTDCQYFSLDNTGKQKANNATSGSGTDTTTTCW